MTALFSTWSKTLQPCAKSVQAARLLRRTLLRKLSGWTSKSAVPPPLLLRRQQRQIRHASLVRCLSICIHHALLISPHRLCPLQCPAPSVHLSSSCVVLSPSCPCREPYFLRLPQQRCHRLCSPCSAASARRATAADEQGAAA